VRSCGVVTRSALRAAFALSFAACGTAIAILAAQGDSARVIPGIVLVALLGVVAPALACTSRTAGSPDDLGTSRALPPLPCCPARITSAAICSCTNTADAVWWHVAGCSTWVGLLLWMSFEPGWAPNIETARVLQGWAAVAGGILCWPLGEVLFGTLCWLWVVLLENACGTFSGAASAELPAETTPAETIPPRLLSSSTISPPILLSSSTASPGRLLSSSPVSPPEQPSTPPDVPTPQNDAVDEAVDEAAIGIDLPEQPSTPPDVPTPQNDAVDEAVDEAAIGIDLPEQEHEIEAAVGFDLPEQDLAVEKADRPEPDRPLRPTLSPRPRNRSSSDLSISASRRHLRPAAIVRVAAHKHVLQTRCIAATGQILAVLLGYAVPVTVLVPLAVAFSSVRLDVTEHLLWSALYVSLAGGLLVPGVLIGQTVNTHSCRRPPADDAVAAERRAEQARMEFEAQQRREAVLMERRMREHRLRGLGGGGRLPKLTNIASAK
jgi:hypothetical protein